MTSCIAACTLSCLSTCNGWAFNNTDSSSLNMSFINKGRDYISYIKDDFGNYNAHVNEGISGVPTGRGITYVLENPDISSSARLTTFEVLCNNGDIRKEVSLKAPGEDEAMEALLNQAQGNVDIGD